MTFIPSGEQSAIINSPLDSARVAAGAGTGKTTTIAQRVVRLVAQHGIEPEQILGITFTNKAAEELADRMRTALDGLVQPGREVSVHTYHGFASAVLWEFGALVNVERDTDIITPAFSRQMLAEITRQLRYVHWDPTIRGAVEKLRRLASQLSDNLLTPTSVPTTDDPDSGPWPVRLELLATLHAYDLEKERLGLADFGDLIRKAHDLVTTNDDIRRVIAERYSAVLLDEYQDTDPGQRELLRVVFGTSVPVMAVGDADQTIYEWRGASKENFEQFSNHFRLNGAQPLEFPLSLNRRSGPAILDVANRIRARIDDTDRSDLTAVSDASPGRVVSAILPTAVAEADWIAEQIRELAEDGVDYRAMAVLFRKNKDMLNVHDALARHGIPFEVANLGGLLTVPEVAEIHAWLRVIERPEDSVAAARLLLGGRFRLGFADLARLNDWIRAKRPQTRDSGEHDVVLDYTFLEAIEHLDEVPGLRSGAIDPLRQFRDEYRHLVTVAQGSALIELCREILDRTNAWSDIGAMPDASRQSARLNVHRFLDLAEDWSPLEGRPSLMAFLSHLDDLELEGSEELDTARLSDADSVTLITVHRAKGLEWDAVFLPVLVARNFPSGSSRFDDPFRFPDSLPAGLRIDSAFSEITDPDEYDSFIRSRHWAQEWRIAYVAATRAKSFLAASMGWWNGVEQPLAKVSAPSELFELIDSSADRVVDTAAPAQRPDWMHYRTSTSAPPDPHFEPDAGSVFRSALTDPTTIADMAHTRGVANAYDRAVSEFQQMLFDLPEPMEAIGPGRVTTSATGLVTYRQCPKKYYWTAVDPLPRRGSPAAQRGTAVHRQIELHNIGMVPLTDSLDTADPLDSGSEHDGPTGPSPFDVFRSSRFASAPPAMTEAPFEFDLDIGITVRGRIDAVYEHQDHWEVVDFKSGRPRSDPTLNTQLQTYALALDRTIDLEGKPIAATFAYLGGGELVEVTSEADSGWIEQALADLNQLGGGILAEVYTPAPALACGSCDFLRFCAEGRAHVEQP